MPTLRLMGVGRALDRRQNPPAPQEPTQRFSDKEMQEYIKAFRSDEDDDEYRF